MKTPDIKKIVLAYSGGLDTSIIIPWLKEQYNNAEIIGVCTNVGQKEDWDAMQQKAKASGASKLYIVDIREEFVKEYLFRMVRAGARYENRYLLGTSIARPLQAKCQVDIALKEGADAVAHGCTGKGNDQVRFELTYKALAPQLAVIAPWRIWDISSREDAIEYAEKHNIPIGNISRKNIYSRDANLWHMSHEGGDLEDPWNRPQEEMFQLTSAPKNAPDKETEIVIDFEKGFPVGLNGQKLPPIEILQTLNKLASENGIGREDIIETRVVGMKSRGVYETPGGTILIKAMEELEMLCMESDVLSFKRIISQKYADIVYEGKWYTTFRASMDAYLDKACEYVTGSIRLVLYKGNIIVAGKRSPYSLYIEDLASFGQSSYDHKDAGGFINLYGLATGVAAMVHKKLDPDEGQGPEMKEIAATFHEK